MFSKEEQEKHIQVVADRISETLNIIHPARKLVYVGRFCPMHLGHQVIISGIQRSSDNHLILIGSCNQPISYRNLFDFKDRLDFIKIVFPHIKIAGLPDFRGDNDSWFRNLDSMLSITGQYPGDAVFVGGCEEDVALFRANNRSVHVVNRFSGLTKNISGTEIRDHLINSNVAKLDECLDYRIVPTVLERFKAQWEKFKQF